MKQGVQLLLERVQRHRAFPRLAAANGQNLQATLSPANNPAPLDTRLEPPRFVPVLAEHLGQNVSGLENTVFERKSQVEINTFTENTLLEVEAGLSDQGLANDSTQFDEQTFAQALEQNLIPEPSSALETERSLGFEGNEIVEPRTSSENLVSETPNQNAATQPTNLPRAGQQSEIANDRSSNPSSVQQAYGVQPPAIQNNQAANQQPPSGTPQTRETAMLSANSKLENSSAQLLPPTEFAIPPLNLNLKQDISFSEPNQNQETTSIAEEISGSAASTFLETPDLISPEITQTVTVLDKSQVESAAPIEIAQAVRSPSRLESTLEALRQFNPQTQHGETMIGSQPAPQNPRVAKTSDVSPSKTSSIAPSEAVLRVQPSSQQPLEPNLTQAQRKAENQNALESKTTPNSNPQVEPSPQNPKTIQSTLETLTRANPGLPTEFAVTREADIEVVQTENTKTQNADIEVTQVQLDSLASEQSGVEEQINVSDLQQNQTATPQTRLTQTDQTEEPLVATTQTELPQVNSSQPESERDTSNLERPNNQRPSEDTRGNVQSSSQQNGLAAPPTVQAPLSEEARERVAYQRAVTMRAERAKRALAAKEELERDPTLEPEVNEAPTNRSSEPQQAAMPDLTLPLETQPQTEVMPSIETTRQAGFQNQNPQIQNLQTSGSSQTLTHDLTVAVASNSSEPFANNVEPEKAIVTARVPELLSKSPGIDSRTPQALHSSSEPQALILSELKPANSSQLKPANSSELEPANSNEIHSENPIEFQSINSSEFQSKNLNGSRLPNPNLTLIENLNQPASEIQTPNSSETQTSGLNRSWVEDAAEIQSNANSSDVQNSNLAENPSQITTLNSSQAVTTPSQDVPASFLINIPGVSVYNPQRRIQRTAPTPPPKPKHEPNEAEKLFADTPGMSQQDIINVIRKAQGLPPLPSAGQVQNADQENTQAQRDTRATHNPTQETPQPAEQNVELNNPSLITAASRQNNTDARVEQALGEVAIQSVNTSGLNLNDAQNGETASSHFAPNQSAQVSQSPSVVGAPARQNAVDANGNKIHVFNPPNRRVLAPKPKVEQPKTEAQKLFDAMEITETADELFQRVVKNRLKANASLEPEERVQNSKIDFENSTSSLEASLPSSGQTLLPNLPNLANRNALNSNNQPANVSYTGNERLQLGASERVQLSQNATRFLKPIVGIDPNDVKIYRDPQTERLTKAARADALTLGETVLLSSEQALESAETLGLIAHELTHVARNRQARFVPPVARGNNNLAANAQSGNEEGLALGVEAFARQGWNNFNQNTPPQNTPTQSPRSQTTLSNTQTNRSSAGGLPAPADLPTWFIEDRQPPQATSRPAPRASNAARSATSESPFVPPAPTNQMAASIGAQAASQDRDVPTPPPAAGPLPASPTPKPEPIANRAAPDLDAMARQVYTILKRRLANERHRM